MEPAVRVLIVEDHRKLAAKIGSYLRGHGCVVDIARNGVTGLHLALVNAFDAIVLDLTLPPMGSIDVCRALRREARMRTPVLMLSACRSLDQKLVGFQSGADDYVAKPFALAELGARIAAITRRSRRLENQVLHVADLSYNIGTLVVLRAGVSIQLHTIELKLLRVLLEASPSVVTQHDLRQRVWGNEPSGVQALCTAIHRLRVAIDKPFEKPLIRTRSTFGYCIVDPDAVAAQTPVAAIASVHATSSPLGTPNAT